MKELRSLITSIKSEESKEEQLSFVKDKHFEKLNMSYVDWEPEFDFIDEENGIFVPVAVRR